jgi:hypothetical protein
MLYAFCCLQGSSTEAREAAAEGLGEMVAVTSQDSLRPFVVQITGPLIRIIGDRFPSQVGVCLSACVCMYVCVPVGREVLRYSFPEWLLV